MSMSYCYIESQHDTVNVIAIHYVYIFRKALLYILFAVAVIGVFVVGITVTVVIAISLAAVYLRTKQKGRHDAYLSFHCMYVCILPILHVMALFIVLFIFLAIVIRRV